MEKMKKLLFAFVCLFGVGMINAEAKVTFNGKELTSENAKITAGEGTVSYVKETNTLTLSDATITLEQIDDDALIVISKCEDFTIVLEGRNTITDVGDKNVIYSDSCDVTIKGTGSLESSSNINNVVVDSGSLTIENVKLNLTSKFIIGDNVVADENITVKNATLYLKGGLAALSASNITIDNSVVDLLGKLGSFGSPDWFYGNVELKNLDTKVTYAWINDESDKIVVNDPSVDKLIEKQYNNEYTVLEALNLGIGYLKTVATYAITIDKDDNSIVTVENNVGILYGETREISITSKDDYKITSVLVNGEEKLSEVNDGKLVLTITENTEIKVTSRVVEKKVETPEIDLNQEVKKVTIAVKEDGTVTETLTKALENSDIDVSKFDSKIVVSVENQTEDVVPVKAVESINDLVKENGNLKISSFFDITLNVLNSDTNTKIGTLTELDKKLAFNVALPEGLTKVADGYTRTYYIVRYHNGISEILDTTLNGNVLTFETDKFSTYAIAYTDTKNTPTIDQTTKDTETKVNQTTSIDTNKNIDTETVVNPSTGDNVTLYVVTTLVSLIGLTYAIYTFKREN